MRVSTLSGSMTSVLGGLKFACRLFCNSLRQSWLLLCVKVCICVVPHKIVIIHFLPVPLGILLSCDLSNGMEVEGNRGAKTQHLLGEDLKQFLRDAVGAVGSCAEMHNMTLQKVTPRAVANLLNEAPNCYPQHFPLPLCQIDKKTMP